MKDKIILCPGKIPVKSKTQPWYMPCTVEDNNFVLCESCYKTFGGMMDPICFKIVYGEKYTCGCILRKFDESSTTINNIRVSFINPDNFFRYRFTQFRNEITVNIPRSEPYKIIIENLEDVSRDNKISVDKIIYNGTIIDYHNKKYPRYLIIDIDDDMNTPYNKSSASEKMITFKVNKWERMKDRDMKQYYCLINNNSEFKFKLNFSNGEKKIMDHVLKINENLPDRKEKVIYIEDFIQ